MVLCENLWVCLLCEMCARVCVLLSVRVCLCAIVSCGWLCVCVHVCLCVCLCLCVLGVFVCVVACGCVYSCV